MDFHNLMDPALTLSTIILLNVSNFTRWYRGVKYFNMIYNFIHNFYHKRNQYDNFPNHNIKWQEFYF